jgi:hypothetical protein
MAGKFIFGFFLILTISAYRTQFFGLLSSSRNAVIGLNVLNETLGLIAEISLVFALLLAPVVLVQSVSSLQPMFVFILGLILTIWFPKFVKESLGVFNVI